MPEPLKRQLAIGGRLVVPVGGEDMQTLTCVTRTGEEEWREDDLGAGALRSADRRAWQAWRALRGRHARGDQPPARTQRNRCPNASPRAPSRCPTIDDAAFAAAFDRFADQRVVLLGEASHGTHEFYAARAAITRRFVEKHGFTIVAAEADWPDAAVLDRHIRHQPSARRRPAPVPPLSHLDVAQSRDRAA